MDQAQSLATIYANLGQALYQAGHFKEAVEALRKALEDDAHDVARPQVYVTLGKSYRELDKNNEAVAAFTEAVKLDASTFDAVKEDIAALDAGKTIRRPFLNLFARLIPGTQTYLRTSAIGLLKQENFAEAEALLSIIVRSSPNDLDAQEHLGWALIGQEKYPEAWNVFEKILRKDKDRLAANHGLGRAYFGLKRYREAVDALGRVVEVDGGCLDALLYLGRARRELGDLAASENDLIRAIQVAPSDHRLYCDLAETQQALGKHHEAAAALTHAAALRRKLGDFSGAETLGEKAVSLDPASGSARLELARALVHQQRYDQARAHLEKAVDLEPTVEVLLEHARVCLEQGATEDALRSAEKALQLSPESGEALVLKGVILHQSGDLEGALVAVEAALARGFEQPQALAAKGDILAEAGRIDDALEAYERATALNPADGYALGRIGLLRFSLDDDESAIEALEKAIALAPGAELYRTKGQALASLGRHEEAIEAYDDALRLDPGDTDTIRWRGFALREIEQYNDAVTTLQLAIDLDAAQGHEDPQTYAELGESLRSLDRFREARTSFRTSIRLWGEEEDAWTLARYGETLRALNKHDDAVRELERAVKLDPNDAWAWGSLGSAQHQLDRHRSALVSLDRAIELDPSYSWAWAWKGLVFCDAEQYQKGIEYLDRALQVDPTSGWILANKGSAVCQFRDLGPKQAHQILRQAILLDPTFGPAYGWLGTCLYQLGEWSEAVAAVDQGVVLDSSTYIYNAIKGLALDKQGDSEKAAEAHRQALGDAVDAKNYIARGYLYAASCAFTRALHDLRTARRLDPSSPEAHNAWAWIYVVDLRDKLGRATKLAQEAVERARAKGDLTLEANALDTLGWCYYKRDLLAEALPLLEEASRKDPEDVEISEHLDTCRRAISGETHG